MTARALKALKGSIKKWEIILNHGGIDRGNVNCPLCRQYAGGDQGCGRCPVHLKTHQWLCNGTPYMAWVFHQHECHNGPFLRIREGCPACRDLATRELDFLVSLLPRKKGKKNVLRH